MVGDSLWVTLVSSTTKTGHHDIAEIPLKVVLNTIKSNQPIEKYIDLETQIQLICFTTF
jgi:hypothetical protein